MVGVLTEAYLNRPALAAALVISISHQTLSLSSKSPLSRSASEGLTSAEPILTHMMINKN